METKQLKVGERLERHFTKESVSKCRSTWSAPGMQMKATLRNLCTSTKMVESKTIQSIQSAGEDPATGAPVCCWQRCKWWDYSGKQAAPHKLKHALTV